MNTHTENEAFIKQLMLLLTMMMMRKLIMNANDNDTKVLVSFVCICVCVCAGVCVIASWLQQPLQHDNADKEQSSTA